MGEDKEGGRKKIMNLQNVLEEEMQKEEPTLCAISNKLQVFKNEVFCYSIRSEMYASRFR